MSHHQTSWWYHAVRAYGYEPIEGAKGQLRIVDSETAIIRRIFKEYADGRTPRQIAQALNSEKVPPPAGSSSA